MLSSILRQARSLKRLITTTLKNTMAKISTYPTDSNITSSDMLIGTDADNSNATKNYTVGGLQSFFSQTFVPYTGATQDVDLGAQDLITEGYIDVGEVTSLGNITSVSGQGKFEFGVIIPNGPITLGAGFNDGILGDVLLSQGPSTAPTWSTPAWLLPAAAAFYDTTNQQAVAGTPTPMEFNSTDIASTSVIIANDLSSNPTRITISDSGVFNIQFSAQLFKAPAGGTEKVSIWLRKNGVDVPNSTTHVTLRSNGDYVVAAWNFFVNATNGDYFNIMWASLLGSAIIQYEAADPVLPHPAVPSIILTVNKIA